MIDVRIIRHVGVHIGAMRACGADGILVLMIGFDAAHISTKPCGMSRETDVPLFLSDYE